MVAAGFSLRLHRQDAGATTHGTGGRLDGHGPIELLQEDETGEFMGQGEAGQSQAFRAAARVAVSPAPGGRR